MPSATRTSPTVFISYRREGGFYLAKLLFDYLRKKNLDVFMDLEVLGSGDFETTTLAEIRRRDNFVIVLTAGSLDRMRYKDDWLRKELVTALGAKRNIVPLLDVNFRLGSPELNAIPKELRVIGRYNAVEMPIQAYMNDGFKRLLSFLTTVKGRQSAPVDLPSGLKEADRSLREMDLPSTRTVPAAERRSMSWQDMQQRLLGSGDVASESLFPPSTLTTLSAPKLSKSSLGAGVSWTEVRSAAEYVVERDTDKWFPSPTDVYTGDRTSYFDFLGMGQKETQYYRVKARNQAGLFADSPWSNTVALEPIAPATLSAPKLTKSSFAAGITWTTVPSAAEYVVEMGRDTWFTSSTVVYTGDRTSYFSFSLAMGEKETHYYRVKARNQAGSYADSPWSNTIAVEA